MSKQEDIKKLAGLIKDVKIAMMTTKESDGCLRSRPMATQETEFDGDLWFFTGKNSTKVQEVNAHHDVNIAYANPNSNTYVSVCGKAELVLDKKKMEELWSPVLKAWFPDGLDDPNLALLKVTVEGAEYWDSPSSPVVNAISFVKAVATGETYTPSKSEHDKIKL